MSEQSRIEWTDVTPRRSPRKLAGGIMLVLAGAGVATIVLAGIL